MIQLSKEKLVKKTCYWCLYSLYCSSFPAIVPYCRRHKKNVDDNDNCKDFVERSMINEKLLINLEIEGKDVTKVKTLKG